MTVSTQPFHPASRSTHRPSATDILTEANWQKANRAFICKSISELMHELLIHPKPVSTKAGICSFELCTDDRQMVYCFNAKRQALDYWYVLPHSLQKKKEGQVLELNGPDFFMELHKGIGMTAHTLSRFMEEAHRTLYADCYLLSKGKPTADAIAGMNHQLIEHFMNGHPWLIMNKGRIGFGADDYLRYTPEAAEPLQLLWLALHRSQAEFHSINKLDYDALIAYELGEEELEAQDELLRSKGLDPQQYRRMPVHAWQWNHKLAFQFASDIAAQRIVPLHFGKDFYEVQQSIRTLYNSSHPQKHYVKTALSILNTTLYRGLSPAKLKVAPVMADWVNALLAGDAYLERCGFSLLNEVATMSYMHPQYSRNPEGPYQFNEMLGVIWRESIHTRLGSGEQAMTMAALLYVDENETPLVQALAEKAGMPLEEWIAAYLSAYFKPLLHCFYKHQMFFVPHGENIIVILKDHVPVRVVLKDFVEEVQLAPDAYNEAPERIREILYAIPEEDVTLFIFVDIFNGFFRYLSSLLSVHVHYSQDLFWRQVAAVIQHYQHEHPELQSWFERYDLFAPQFRRFCLNRFRLVTFGYAESATAPAEPPYAGMLDNPVAIYAAKPSAVSGLKC